VYWGWLGSRRALEPEAPDKLARFDPVPGSAICVGTPEFGPAGFRNSHREAGEAFAVARRRPQPLTLYADVALEALALRDEPAARAFVASQLRSLGGDDRLRTTLRRYFATSQNAAATAAALHVHEQTVARRLKAVEAKIGCPLQRRHAELELALRLEELLAEPPAAA
jgi:DNA-binding PucR family transcriptional regulator